MISDRIRRVGARILLLVAVFVVCWIMPPAVHQIRRQCPVRPDGINSAEAVPAFARKYGFSCMQCHTNWPTLNEYGRQFKLNGYVPSRDGEEGVLKSKDGSLWIERNFPISVIVRSRPFEQTKHVDQEFKMTPISDVDLFVAGGDAAHHVSWFGELDANAAAGNGFAVSMGDLQLGYHHNDYLNVIGARRGFFVMDPYQTLTNFGSPTIADRAISGGQIADLPPSMVTMDQTSQTMYAYGEVGNDKVGYLYYAGGASADSGSDAGTGGKNANARLAYDTGKGLVVGTFGSYGHAGAASYGAAAAAGTVIDRTEFRRGGVDLLVEKGPVTARAAYMYGSDHDTAHFDPVDFPNGDAKETNRIAYAELQYVYKRTPDGVPFLVPLIRQNWWTSANSTRQFASFTAQVAHYFAANAKGFIEATWDTKQDIVGANVTGVDRAPKGSTLAAQFEVGF